MLFLPFSASVSFRLLPPSSYGFRFGSLLVRVSDGNTSGGQDDDIWKPNMPWAKFLEKSTDSSDVAAIFQLRSASVVFRQLPFRVASGPCVGWQRGWGQGEAVGRAYLDTQHAMGRICGENRPILVPLMRFVCFRQLPLSPVSFRFGPHLVRVADGDMSGGQGDDAGGAYLETQHALGQICGENRPIVVLFPPFSCFRQLPSASAICRRIPFRAASGPRGRWQHVWGP